jgi:HK97 family phage major capsid protein
MITFKDLAALKAKALTMFESYTQKGMKPADALSLVKSYLDENEFADESGNSLKLDLEMHDLKGDEPVTKAAGLDDKAIVGIIQKTAKEIVKEILPGIVQTSGDGAVTKRHIQSKDRWEFLFEDPKWEFKNVGEFALSIYHNNQVNLSQRHEDPRLALLGQAQKAIKNGHFKAAPTTYASELVGADGGFLVPPEYRREIWTAVHDQYSILNMIDLTPTASNAVNFNVDENTPWDNTSGIRVFWRQQASSMTQTKPTFQNRQVPLHDLSALVAATDEVLSDAPMLNNYLSVKAPEKIGYQLDDVIFRGTGNGQPLGFMNSASYITVTANSTASGYSVTDLANMSTRLLDNSNMQTTDGCWLFAPREHGKIVTLGTSSNAGFPLAMSNQNIQGKTILTILGMPVYKSQHLPGMDLAGSIMLVNFKGYAGFNKEDGFDFQSSIHLFFDAGATAFRWRFRFGGEPKLRQTVSSANDTGNTMSHFIALGSRP